MVVFREALYACRVADVSQYPVGEGGLQCRGGLIEAGGLLVGEGIEVAAVAAGKVREYRTGNDGTLLAQPLDEARHLIGAEAEAAHARVYLYMYGIVHVSLALASVYHRIEQGETVYLGLQIVVK